MRLLWNNLYDGGTITPSTEDADYLAANLKDTRLSRKWRSTADTGQTIVVDMGSAVTVTAAAIAAHNLTSGAVIKIQGNATDAWGTPSVDETITWIAGTIVIFFTGGSYRYWRFTFEDGSNPDTYISIGRLYLGTYFQVLQTFNKEFTEETFNTDIASYSQSGQLYTRRGFDGKQYNLMFPYWTNTVKQAVEAIVETVGKRTPFFLVLDEDNIDVLPVLYCHIPNDPQYPHFVDYNWKASLSFREVF